MLHLFFPGVRHHGDPLWRTTRRPRCHAAVRASRQPL